MEPLEKVSELAQLRKARSISLLAEQGIPNIDWLPVIEDENTVTPRTLEEIALRTICLSLVAVKGEGLEQDQIDALVEAYQLKKKFTPQELAFIQDANPSQRDRTQFLWRYESLWVLLWSLGYVEELSFPDSICDVPTAVSAIFDRGRDKFITQARLRPLSEVLDQADLIYRYNWAATDARVNNKSIPENLDPSVVYERHYALNWLIRYRNADWDEVSTDT